jgi:uncharacterized protein (DUF1499 family)
MKLETIIGAAAFAAIFFSCSGTRPSNVGVKEGVLAPCPGSPNCVSSQAPVSDKEHYIAPIKYAGTLADAKKKLVKVIESMKRARIVTDKGDFIYAQYTSALFRFVDDVEFYFNDAEKIIQVRSASRLGYGDMGVNRRRVEEIRRRFAE